MRYKTTHYPHCVQDQGFFRSQIFCPRNKGVGGRGRGGGEECAHYVLKSESCVLHWTTTESFSNYGPAAPHQDYLAENMRARSI